MNLLHLQYFYEIAKSGSISLAAKRLRVSQPAVSKMVKTLEQNLGVTLFERRRKGIVLTHAGKEALHSAAQIFSQAQALEKKLSQNSGVLTGELNLGVSDNLAIHIFPELLDRFKKSHPGVKLSLFAGTSNQIKDELKAGRCEVGIFYTPVSAHEDFISEEVGRAEFLIVIGKKSHWETALKKLTLENLKKVKVPKIGSRLVDYKGGSIPAHFHMNQLGLTQSASIEANNHEVQKKLALRGHGYCLQIRHAIEKELKLGQLIQIKTPSPLWSPIYWVVPKGRSLSAEAEEFLALVKKSKLLTPDP
jgi:DNA-binding transcriptional LysR family regulator